MATASVTNSFSAATTISSSQMNTNFSDLVSFLNASVLHLDGSKSMSGDLNLGANDITNAAAGTFSGLVRKGFSGALWTIGTGLACTNEVLRDALWDTAVYDTDSYKSGSDFYHFNAPRTGYYDIYGSVGFAGISGVAQYVSVEIFNYSTSTSLAIAAGWRHDAAVALGHAVPIRIVSPLTAGHQVKLRVYQSSGATRTTSVTPYTFFGIRYLGE